MPQSLSTAQVESEYRIFEDYIMADVNTSYIAVKRELHLWYFSYTLRLSRKLYICVCSGKYKTTAVDFSVSLVMLLSCGINYIL